MFFRKEKTNFTQITKPLKGLIKGLVPISAALDFFYSGTFLKVPLEKLEDKGAGVTNNDSTTSL